MTAGVAIGRTWTLLSCICGRMAHLLAQMVTKGVCDDMFKGT